ncbi:MAG: response regulator [Desulfuromonadales bacterium]|nr:response regulator [Desulfuromonadales bacterium]
MKDIISWLIGIEANAANLYAKAAVLFREDEEFSQFLSLMSTEEKEHEELLQKASVSISDKQMKRASFFLDEGFREKIEAPFARAWQLLRTGELTKEAMIDVLAEAEFSEWNELFLYTIDTLNTVDNEFQKAVSGVDEHRAHIQKYISSLPDGDSFIQRVRKLSQVGSKRVLIVEDNHFVARMLEALVVDEVEVIIARNGEEGLAYIQQGRFDLIVSDIEMPKMNGVDMYKQALAMDPTLCSRFIFFTGTENPEHLAFVRSTKILMLPKPSTVRVICDMMNDILGSTTVSKGATVH